jgi:hypothetical protein
VTHEFDDEVAEDVEGGGASRFLRYPIYVEIPAVEGVEVLEVVCVAGGRDRTRRSFCIPIPR